MRAGWTGYCAGSGIPGILRPGPLGTGFRTHPGRTESLVDRRIAEVKCLVESHQEQHRDCDLSSSKSYS